MHVLAALLTFTAAFLTADNYENLAYALPLSLLVFLLAKSLPRLEVDLHFAAVALMSLLFWGAGAHGFLTLFSMSGGSCTFEFSDECAVELPADAEPGAAPRPPAAEAACYARFPPGLTGGPSARASGVLNCDFGTSRGAKRRP